MKHVGLLAFGITTLVLAPAAIQQLVAGSKQVAKLVAPDTSRLTLNGVAIEVAADRAIMDAGGKVKVTLAASSDAASEVAVDVLVLESAGSDGGRVDSPPTKIAREHVVLRTKPGVATKRELAFTLRGARGMGMGGVAEYGRYTVLVMAPKAADAFEKMRRRALKDDPINGEDNGSYIAFFREWYELGGEHEPDADAEPSKLGKRGEIARLEIDTRPKDSPIALVVPETVRANEPFTVTLKIANKSRYVAKDVHVLLDVPSGLHGKYLGIASDDVTIDIPEDFQITIKPHETKSVQIKVTAKRPGVLGLYAHVDCHDCKVPIVDGALEAIDIEASEAAKPAIVGSVK